MKGSVDVRRDAWASCINLFTTHPHPTTAPYGHLQSKVMGCVHSALWCKHCDSGEGCLYVWGLNGTVQEGPYSRRNKRQPVALEVLTCTYCECYDSCCGGPPLLPDEK